MHPTRCGYNCSPSFNWRKHLDDATIAKFQRSNCEGYKFQFITLAGFHSLNHGMFDLASGNKNDAMTAYCQLQEGVRQSRDHGLRSGEAPAVCRHRIF